MTIRVLGLDISKSSVSACLLETKPVSPRQFYYEYQFHHFDANAAGIKAMLELKPTVAILEPTGVNYAQLWGTHLARAGVEVRLVDHQALRNYRAHHLNLPDKDDDADALALACYMLDYQNNLGRFLQVRDHVTTRLRQLVLRLAHLNRVQSPIINRIRQDLAWQFPEVALVRSLRRSDKVPLLWGWLAGERSSIRYDAMYQNSVGLGITSTVKYHAQRLCNLQREEQTIEDEIYQLLNDSRFTPYRQVFSKFGFGQRLEAVLLSQIYPLESYLVDGQPEVRIRRGRNSGKPTKRYLSQRRFQKALGVAPTLESSGDRHRQVIGGSDLCRKGLWQWVFTRVEPKRSRLKNEIGEKLSGQLDAEKLAGRPVKLVRMRIAAKAAKILFKELITEMCSPRVLE
ncbi:transposase [Nostoc sp. LEGE 06077]|uniref:IS110 family transposase n=1 Tax=Nostoc sp. LEGE 06077 TaxID=915325 RepID=UPI00188104A4|nr:transposase [Nostoc sp. LEGE 06077]MBE9210417.1 transposase [Nostoc sp. LEGE 06077]